MLPLGWRLDHDQAPVVVTSIRNSLGDAAPAARAGNFGAVDKKAQEGMNVLVRSECTSGRLRPSGDGLGLRRLPGRALGLAMAGLLGGCSGILDPAGPVGEAERIILFDSLAIMLAIVVPTIGLTLGFAWWFRAGNSRATYRPEWAYSGRLELLVWSIPALVVLFLGGIAWVGSHDLDPGRPIASEQPPLEIEVVALDWKWLFIYPEERIAAVNGLTIPVGRPLHFRITSASVLNTFFVPRLGSQIYAMNGMASELNLLAAKPGVYAGLSAHFSGDGFSGMHFKVRAVPSAEFETWLASTLGTGPALDDGTYRDLSRQSSNVPPSTFSKVDPGLFERVVNQRLPPGPGPRGQGPDVANYSDVCGPGSVAFNQERSE